MVIRNVKVDIAYLGLLFIAFTMPFSMLINNVAISLSFIPIFLALILDKPLRTAILDKIRGNKIALLFLAFALFYIGSGVYHWQSYRNFAVPYHDLEKRAVFIVFPIIMAIVPLLNEQQIKNILSSFFLGILLSSLILFGAAAYITLIDYSLYYVNPRYGVIENNFMYHRLGSYLGLHAVYYSCMVLLAFILATAYSRANYAKSGEEKRVVMILILAYLLVLLFLLKSAVILIGLMLIVSCYGLYHLIKARRWLGPIRMSLIVGIGIIIMIAFGSRVIDKVGTRGELLSYNFEEPGGGNWNVFSLRKAKWDIATEAISAHWTTGVGPGNIHLILDYYYNKNNFDTALAEHYNPHNQFLDTFLTLGIIGFVTIFAIYALAFYNSIKRTDLVWFLFMIGFTFFSMSESTLSVNKGIIFFVFFTCFFSYLPRSTSTYFR